MNYNSEKPQICFFCGKSEDMEMPMLNYEPCDKCKEEMAQGITLIGVTTYPMSENQMPIDADQELYPTGKWCVITEEAAKRIFDESSSKSLLNTRKGFLSQEVMDMMLPDED